jgi:imidazole glycerol-phosphate synthase subunit HisH
MVTIVDYGVGNINSIQNMLKKCGVESKITNKTDELYAAEKIILPGVGAFDAAMERLNASGLDETIKACADKNIPILGICLGAQLLMESSEEGILPGLGLIQGDCRKFDVQKLAPLRVPHMGWEDVTFTKKGGLCDFEGTPRFYFVHSYYIECKKTDNILGEAVYGHRFTCAVHSGTVSGVQFHPEKSHKFGEKLLSNFSRLQH